MGVSGRSSATAESSEIGESDTGERLDEGEPGGGGDGDDMRDP